MGFHLYCVTTAAITPEGVGGIDGAAVQAIASGGIAAWASPADAPLRASLDAARAHNAVVEAAHRLETPVPLRFGQWLPDEASVRARLAERADDWRTQLAALAGTAEFGVRILDPARPGPAQDVRPESTGAGRAYLEALAGRETERARRSAAGQEIAAALEQDLGGTVLRARVDPLETAHGLATIAHLVRRNDAAAYRSTLERAIAGRPELQFLTSGPWPPYSFAS
jgi:hypothetical protein